MVKAPEIPKGIIEDIGLKKIQEPIKKIIKVYYDGKQFSFKIPILIATELYLKKGDNFEISIENEKDIKLKRV